MTEDTELIPQELNLRHKTRVLEIRFSDDEFYSLPCEYLRVFSPAADARAAAERDELIVGKEDVNIEQINPVGSYAVQFVFDDGHDTGVYSWSTLKQLGKQQTQNWQSYLDKCQARGVVRQEPDPDKPMAIKILYFVTLPKQLGREAEDVQVPASVRDVTSLLEFLKHRGQRWQEALSASEMTITVNKQFAKMDTRLEDGDEVALVPVARI
ncbi:MAG: hypothetical protein BMS9Abin36_1880 [Gammaproteobacteria bacterium]|nr:MAG: hypothetical protein BMS9Abin36_1880 [Gammaproteobacteria bacterium]